VEDGAGMPPGQKSAACQPLVVTAALLSTSQHLPAHTAN
jgi:hypothetical protein